MAKIARICKISLVHKLLISGKPIYLREKLISRLSIHDCNIRNKNTLTMPQHSTASFQRSFTYNSVAHYNALDTKYKSTTLNVFKKLVKELLLAS